MKPHKYADVIKAWADDITTVIEWRRPPDATDWATCINGPSWDENNEYRIKPIKVYPVTQMTNDDLYAVWAKPAPISACVNVANAALRHAIDAGQVVTAEEADAQRKAAYEEGQKVAFKHEAAARYSRDASVAIAMRNECKRLTHTMLSSDAEFKMDYIKINKIIASVNNKEKA